MKKLLSIFAGTTTLAAAGLHVVACSTNSTGKGEIQLITDGGQLNDKSFNQQAWETIQQFSKTVGKRAANKQPKTHSDSLFLDAYKAAFKSEAEIIVANGAFHQNAISSFVKDNKNKWVIYTDEQYKSVIGSATKAASLTFSAEQSGFLAGIAAAVYLNLNYETYKADGLNLASFGGANVTGVTSFMAGLKASTIWWNNKIEKKEQDELKNIIKILTGLTDDNIPTKIEKVNDTTGTSANTVDTGFAVGTEKAKVVIEKLINKKMKMLM